MKEFAGGGVFLPYERNPNISFPAPHDPSRPQPLIVDSGGAVIVKPPSDAIVLFDGTTLDAWTPVADVVQVRERQRHQFGKIVRRGADAIRAERKVDGQAGPLYGQLPPSVNAEIPQVEWQSYDVTFEATMTRVRKI